MLFRIVFIHSKKGKLSPDGHDWHFLRKKQTPLCLFCGYGEKAFSRASLTAEASVVLPVFLVCMILVLQYANVFRCSVRMCGALTRTAEEMAVASYLREFPGAAGDNELAGVAISAAYAGAGVYRRMGNHEAIRSDSLLLSSFLAHDDRIDLVMTYRVRSPVGIVHVPGTVFIQRSCVRGWVGRSGSSGEGGGSGHIHDADTVYVAENGVVYHRDPNCTHIHLSIQSVTMKEALKRRNEYGRRYKCCEKCGRHCGNTVYITTDGSRYHSSLECSGLKRTVSQVSLDNVGNLRPCSKCGGTH